MGDKSPKQKNKDEQRKQKAKANDQRDKATKLAAQSRVMPKQK